MTNALKVSFVSGLLSLVLVGALSFGAFASIAHAQEFDLGSYGGGEFDLGSYGGGEFDLGSYGNSGEFDLGSYGNYGEYDLGSYGNYGEYDLGSYGNYGEYDLGSYGNYGEYDLGSYDNYCGCDYVYDNGVGYSERSYGSTGYASSGGGFSLPSFGRAPSTSYTTSYPTPVQQRPVQQQQQQQQQGGQPINIVNNNVNTNTNTNTNTAPVTPVYQTPVTYPVQYVYPQPVYPTYPTYPTYPVNNTYCTISATQGSVANGQPAYLSWSSNGATSAWLSDGIGQVAVNGSLAVRPNVSKTYTLTVSGYGGTNTCSTYVTVNGSYISLSQIPYTGFDAGLLGNAAYWLSLISFAVAGAYLMIYYKGGAVALAGSMLGSRKPYVSMHETVQVPAEVETKIEIVETPVETMTPSPVDVMERLPVAPTANATMDSMQVLHSKDGGAPRIVISRS